MARYCPLYFLHVGTFCALFIMPTPTDYAQSCARASAANEISQKQKVELSLNDLPGEAMPSSLWPSEDPTNVWHFYI